MAGKMGDLSKLMVCAAVSVGLHAALIGSVEAALRLRVGDHYRSDAVGSPRLRVMLVTLPAPAFSLSSAVPALDEVIARAVGEVRRPPDARQAVAELVRGDPARYYLPREVDVRAVPLSDIEAVNPDLTGRQSGKIVLRILVNAAGTVDNVVVVSSEPQRTFGPAVLTPFRQARFTPARKGNVAVRSQLLIEVEYRGTETNRAPR